MDERRHLAAVPRSGARVSFATPGVVLHRQRPEWIDFDWEYPKTRREESDTRLLCAVQTGRARRITLASVWAERK
jgi:GH18 family chitinase